MGLTQESDRTYHEQLRGDCQSVARVFTPLIEGVRRRHHGRSDFDMTIERQGDPRGDRVKIGMTGKFLPFKYYGATGNAQQYGYKEE